VLGLAAIDHQILKQVEVSRNFPHLRMRDDRGVQTDHAKWRRRIGELPDRVVARHHVVPPRFPNVALELGAERPVVPKAVDAAVNLARLKDEAAPFAQ